MKKKNFRFEPKQTETRSVSRLFRFVSWNQKFFFFVCFGVLNLYRNNRNKQNSFETNRNNPEFSEKYQHFERFGGGCHSFYLFCLFHTFIITFIQYIHSFPFARLLSFSSLLARSEGKTFQGCRAEIWTRACHTVGQRTTNWATLYRNKKSFLLKKDKDKKISQNTLYPTNLQSQFNKSKRYYQVLLTFILCKQKKC